jgi:hypothetical protein
LALTPQQLLRSLMQLLLSMGTRDALRLANRCLLGWTALPYSSPPALHFLISRHLESTGVRLRPPLDHTPLQADEEAAEVAARYQRLLTLQRELAQLKKTPSMQLLARQRISTLEAEIKQLVTALQASA